jgi:hypothetical protein
MQSFDLVVSVEIARRGEVSTRSRGHLVSFTYTFASGLLVPVTGWSAGYLWSMPRVKLGKRGHSSFANLGHRLTHAVECRPAPASAYARQFETTQYI